MRDDQHRKLQLDQLRQMTVHSAIAAKNNHCIRVGRIRGQPNVPERIRDSCKRLQIFGRRMQTEDGGGTHACAARLTKFNQGK